jgi:hypothetical protein
LYQTTQSPEPPPSSTPYFPESNPSSPPAPLYKRKRGEWVWGRELGDSGKRGISDKYTLSERASR